MATQVNVPVRVPVDPLMAPAVRLPAPRVTLLPCVLMVVQVSAPDSALEPLTAKVPAFVTEA
jgi:hypothetical protein